MRLWELLIILTSIFFEASCVHNHWSGAFHTLGSVQSRFKTRIQNFANDVQVAKCGMPFAKSLVGYGRARTECKNGLGIA